MKRIFTNQYVQCIRQVLFIILLCSTILNAYGRNTQILEKKISIALDNVPFENALKEIGRAAHVKFVYSPNQLQNEGNVSIDVQQRVLSEVLDEILTPRQIKFKVHEKESMITLKKMEGEQKEERSSIQSPNSKQQLHQITGLVIDAANQQPMAGVNVIVRGTTNGTSTNGDGRYSLNVENGDVLLFSFIGYATMEVNVGSQSLMDVSLKEDVNSLKEVVINAGYYHTTKASQTGNIGRVEAQEIRKQPVSNPLAAMQGRVPGLEITQETGVPGGNFKVRIRGQNSIANGNDPLYIIDGVPFTSTSMTFPATSFNILLQGNSPLNGINPADIESIEVLKDADATAIYGSRGANGVILITTKKGSAGKPKVDVHFYSGSGNPASKMELMKTPQYLAMRTEAMNNSGFPINGTTAPDLVTWDANRYTDWQDELIGNTATVNDAQIGISGGDPLTQYSVSLGYRKETTVFPGNNGDQRMAAHISLNNKSKNEKLVTSFSVKYSVNTSNLIKRDLTDLALTLPPNAPPLYTEQGDLNWGTDLNSDTWVFPYMNHPLSYLKTDYDSKSKNMLANAVVSYAILPNLFAKVNLGYTDIVTNTVLTTPVSSLAPQVAAIEINKSVFTTSGFNNWTAEPQLNWKPKIGKGQFDILIGTSFLEQVEQGLVQNASGFADEALMKNIGAASTVTASTNYYSQYRYEAFFGRVNYALHEKYFINLTGRRDGSSRFGPGKQFANFGALGLAWVFSEENFLKNNLPFLSFGKLRSSYGITGNDQLGNYQYLDTYTPSGTYQGSSALKPVRLANPDYAWETNKKLEGGIELGFIKNRINASVSLYRNESSNQLVGYSLPPTTGFASVQGNLPAVVQNKGVEIELSSHNIDKGDWHWTTSINLTIPHNKLVSFPNLEASPAYANILIVGKPLSTLKRYEAMGVDAQTGLYTFKDVNEDGSINILDQQTPVFVGQHYYGGLNNTITFRNVQLDILFQFSKQSKLNFINIFSSSPGNGLGNQPDWVTGQWQQPNDVAQYQMFNQNTTVQQAYDKERSSTAGISDGSYIRLKNISLSYELPTLWSKKILMEQARVFVQAQNLLTFTHYKGLDPESTGLVLPPLRMITFGFHFTF